jgi:hypothetical protein
MQLRIVTVLVALGALVAGCSNDSTPKPLKAHYIQTRTLCNFDQALVAAQQFLEQRTADQADLPNGWERGIIVKTKYGNNHWRGVLVTGSGPLKTLDSANTDAGYDSGWELEVHAKVNSYVAFTDADQDSAIAEIKPLARDALPFAVGFKDSNQNSTPCPG